DIRYSLSPRYELETAVSKLCWLDKWVSPAELASAVGSLRNIILSGKAASPGTAAQSGSGRDPAAGDVKKKEIFSQGERGGEERGAYDAAGEGFDLSAPGFFSAEFKKMVAARTGTAMPRAPESPAPADTQGSPLELVRQMFRGTIVKEY
ncbi:MAG: hypothetical protein LBK40_08795, partial [Spirochaetaceae bacterium]|nr:hypothetical protein [Spirochaetaceae bacterium]